MNSNSPDLAEPRKSESTGASVGSSDQSLAVERAGHITVNHNYSERHADAPSADDAALTRAAIIAEESSQASRFSESSRWISLAVVFGLGVFAATMFARMQSGASKTADQYGPVAPSTDVKPPHAVTPNSGPPGGVNSVQALGARRSPELDEARLGKQRNSGAMAEKTISKDEGASANALTDHTSPTTLAKNSPENPALERDDGRIQQEYEAKGTVVDEDGKLEINEATTRGQNSGGTIDQTAKIDGVLRVGKGAKVKINGVSVR